MLVLSRKVGEKVVIGDGIVVVVKQILGQRVTFGIEAPPSVRIVRGELPRFTDAAHRNLPREERRGPKLLHGHPCEPTATGG
jgi:carbon storage regulator CsrA